MQWPNFRAIYFGHAAYSVLILEFTILTSLKQSPIDFKHVASIIFGLIGLLFWLIEDCTLVAFLIAKTHALRFPESPFAVRFIALHNSVPGRAILVPFSILWNWRVLMVLLAFSFQEQKLGPVMTFISLGWLHPALPFFVLGILLFPAWLSLFSISLFLGYTMVYSCWVLLCTLWQAARAGPPGQKYSGVPTQEQGWDLEAMPSTSRGP